MDDRLRPWLSDENFKKLIINFINVILPIPLQKLFTYRITEAEVNFIKIGTRVAVPFGKSKIYTAIVFEINSNLRAVIIFSTLRQR